MRTAMIAVAAALSFAGAARGEVVDAQPNGFEVRRSVEIAAPAAKVWAALGQPAAWWDSGHSWSGDAKNLSIDLKPGGCWCEALPKTGGGALHMTVIFVDPGKTLRLAGALGPLSMSGADGHMVWSLAEKGPTTTLTWTYDVGGYFKGGLDKRAGPVDGVLGAQVARLKAYVETGKPE
ncbi:MAG TPA: SRPBCC family protein [Caulobacteraceae bacterium]|nr:SRPBCC family protein [Caulobacteraceae bacterium]